MRQPCFDADVLLRKCKKCQREKSLADFTKSKQCKFGYTHTCLECNRRRWAPYYHKNREERKAEENRKNRERKSLIVKRFGSKCFDCNQTFPDCVFDFHHLDPAVKDIQISLIRSISEKLWKELEKCVMLCSNCHRIRHMSTGKGGRDATID